MAARMWDQHCRDGGDRRLLDSALSLLADAGIRVCLVNARHVKNVPGRKSDVRDCQWLQYLHSVGLLTASYRPDQTVCRARSIYRFRQNLLTLGGQHLQHMQAALDR
jgi:transposase